MKFYRIVLFALLTLGAVQFAEAEPLNLSMMPQTPEQPQTYKVGDFITKNGVVGFVFMVSADGKHGKLMSVKESNGNWNSAKSWCAKLGEGWRLPSRNELKVLYAVQSAVMDALTQKNYAPIDGLYWSDEEFDQYSAWFIDMSGGDEFNFDKYQGNKVRAVTTF